ncbi:MAG: hypothetical protein HZA63_00550 [Rhodocyclales bacterium]|nr:hypothetical protein [Rhodocyclales bacterium]
MLPTRAIAGLLRASALALGLALGGAAAADTVGKFPDVVAVQVRASGAERFDFDVTVASPYDTAQRYADGFRAGSLDGKTIYGERKLWHDHAGEQPFTRDLHGVAIPRGVRQVRIQARDQVHGYGGRSVDVTLPGR